MPKLHQVVAAIVPIKKAATEQLTKTYQQLKSADLYHGQIKTYRPFDEASLEPGVKADKKPDETKQIQRHVPDVLAEIEKCLSALADTTVTQDVGNQQATGTIRVDDLTVENVPVTTLLFLYHQLEDMRTVINHLPTRDPAKQYKFDDTVDAYATDPEKTYATKKITKTKIVVMADDKHPAQTKDVTEDVQVGEFSTRYTSSAISLKEKNAMLERVNKLLAAVVDAREVANTIDVKRLTGLGGVLNAFVFRGVEQYFDVTA